MANSFSECFKFSSLSPARTDCLHSLLSSFLAANNFENPAQTRLNNTGIYCLMKSPSEVLFQKFDEMIKTM